MTAQPAALSETAAAIEISGLSKWFGDFQVLRDISLTVRKGERIVVCGPSGSGKSTLIRCINRLETHQQGKIVVNGVELSDNLKNIDQVDRKSTRLNSSHVSESRMPSSA